MQFKILKDKNEAKAVLCHPAIYPLIGSDSAPPVEEYEPGEAIYYGGYVDGNLVAVMVFHYKTPTLGKCHVQVLPDFREKYADYFAKSALFWWSTVHNVKLVAEIPEIYPNVIYFGLKHGFKIDGRVDNAYLKDGLLHSVYYLSREVM